MGQKDSKDRLIRIKEVAAALGISTATVWRAIQRGELPAGKKISKNTTVWKESEIQAFIHAL